MTNSKLNSGSNGSSSEEVVSSQVRQRSTSYPRYSLRQAEEFARAGFDEGPRRCDQDTVARKAGYKNAENGSFKSLRAAAKYFGLVEYEGGDCLSVSEEWIDIFKSEDPELTRRARQAAVQRPALYRQLLEEYADRQLPSPEKLTRELHINQKYGIVKQAAERAAGAFLESASHAGMVDGKNFLRISAPIEEAAQPTDRDTPFTKDVFSDLFGPTNKQQRPDAQAMQQSPPQQQSARGDEGEYQAVVIPTGLERHEVQLRNGKKAYFFVPVPLPTKDKERLKQYIGLILDEDDVETQPQPAVQKMADSGPEEVE